jgi:hypothetical protein
VIPRFFRHPADIADNAVKWTSERLKQAKVMFDGQMARSQATHKGVKAKNLMEVMEPEHFIFCVLHNQMGLVNKLLEHLLLLAEKHIEKLLEGHAK